jgi:hypothetical protein
VAPTQPHFTVARLLRPTRQQHACRPVLLGNPYRDMYQASWSAVESVAKINAHEEQLKDADGGGR